MLFPSAIGRAGEYLAASAIELQGWGVSPASLQHIDLLAVRENYVLKIQVKATMRRGGDNRYHFNIVSPRQARITPHNVDIVALAMLDTKQVYFIAACGLRQTFAVNNSMLALKDMETVSWKAAVLQSGILKDEEAP